MTRYRKFNVTAISEYVNIKYYDQNIKVPEKLLLANKKYVECYRSCDSHRQKFLNKSK